MQVTVLPGDVPTNVSKQKIHWKDLNKAERGEIRKRVRDELEGQREIPLSRLISLVRTYVLQVAGPDRCLFTELTPIDLQGILASTGYKYVTVEGKQDRKNLTPADPHGGSHTPKESKLGNPSVSGGTIPIENPVTAEEPNGKRLKLNLPKGALRA